MTDDPVIGTAENLLGVYSGRLLALAILAPAP